MHGSEPRGIGMGDMPVTVTSPVLPWSPVWGNLSDCELDFCGQFGAVALSRGSESRKRGAGQKGVQWEKAQVALGVDECLQPQGLIVVRSTLYSQITTTMCGSLLWSSLSFKSSWRALMEGFSSYFTQDGKTSVR